MGGRRTGGGEAREEDGEGVEGREGTQGPAEAKDARFIRPAEAAGGTPVVRGAGCAPRHPCGEGQQTAAHPGSRAAPAAASRSPGREAPALRRPGSPPPPPPLGRGVWCLRGASVGAGAGAGAHGTRGPAGAQGAEELGARRRAASSSCRTGPRRPAAAVETERRRRRRPGQRRARSGSGSCHCQLPARPQRRQSQQHYRRQRG